MASKRICYACVVLVGYGVGKRVCVACLFQQAQTGGGEGDEGKRIAVDPEAGVQVSGGGGGRKGDSYPVIPVRFTP